MVPTETTERTTATRLNRADWILVQWNPTQKFVFAGDKVTSAPGPDHLALAGRKPPKRAFWACVTHVERTPGGTGVQALILDINGAATRRKAKGDLAVTRLVDLRPAPA